MTEDTLIKIQPTITNFIVGYPYIITTRSLDWTPDAMTLSYVTAIHWNPPTIIMSIDSNHKTSSNLIETSKFTLSILRRNETSKEIAGGIASISGKIINKFDDLYFLQKNTLNDDTSWPPIIQGSILVLHGNIIKNYEYKGQIIFFGEIKTAKITNELNNLIFKNRDNFWQALDEVALNHADVYGNI